METPRTRLLFVNILNNSFVAQDREVLEAAFEVHSFAFGFKKGLAHVWRQLALLTWLLRNIWRARHIFIWFADYHAFLPSLLGRLLGKSVTIVIGGFDAVKRPDLQYGGHTSALRSRVIGWCCRAATRLLPVSNWTVERLEQNTGLSLRDKSTILYNGVDAAIFTKSAEAPSARTGVVCVAAVKDLRTLRVKGLDRVKELAASFPEVPFCIAGVSGAAAEALRQDMPPNLELIEWVKRSDIEALYRRYKVVCQLSRTESFGLALAEGMYAGCVGVSIADLGCAEIISEGTGYLADSGDGQALRAVMEQALAAPPTMHEAAPAHIKAHFLLADRAKRLMDLLKITD